MLRSIVQASLKSRFVVLVLAAVLLVVGVARLRDMPLDVLPEFSPDGRFLLSSAWDATIKIWDLKEKSEVATLIGHKGAVTSLAVNSAGNLLASGSWDRTVRLWDFPSGKGVALCMGHDKTVTSVAFTPDSSKVASGSWDKSVRLWDTASGQERQSWKNATATPADCWPPSPRRRAVRRETPPWAPCCRRPRPRQRASARRLAQRCTHSSRTSRGRPMTLRRSSSRSRWLSNCSSRRQGIAQVKSAGSLINTAASAR